MLRHDLMCLQKPYWISYDDYFYMVLKDCCDDYDAKNHRISYTEICSQRELPTDLTKHKKIVGKYVYCFYSSTYEKCVNDLDPRNIGDYRIVRTYISGICSPKRYNGKTRPIKYIVGDLDYCDILDEDSLYFDKKVLRDTWLFMKSELEQDFEKNIKVLLDV